jgi:LPS export ABC transporter protein LptC
MARFLQYVLAARVVRPSATLCLASRFFGVFVCALCVVLMLGCEEIEEPKPWIRVERPQMLFTDTTLLDSYDKGVLNWRLKTAYLERWADKEIVTVRPVFVDIYDSVGERVAFLRADSGSLDMKFTYVYAYGHVYALTPKGASVRADSLLWNKKDNLVKTASYVRVVSEDGDVLQGVGFESDAKLDNWKILSNVTGIFQDAAKRMKDEDKKQAEAQRLNNPPLSSSQAVSSQSAKPSRPAAQNPAAPRPVTPQSASSRPAAPTSAAAPTSQSSALPRSFMRPHGLFAKPNAGNP